MSKVLDLANDLTSFESKYNSGTGAFDSVITDTISESTTGSGVTIDGLKIKDTGIQVGGLERVNIDSSGYVIFNSSLTNNTYIKGGGYYTFAANGSTLNIQPTTAFTALILVYDPGGGAGAAFLSTYQNSVVKIAGDAGWYDSDTAGNFCVFKSINSHNSVTVKNNSIYVRNFYITVISTG